MRKIFTMAVVLLFAGASLFASDRKHVQKFNRADKQKAIGYDDVTTSAPAQNVVFAPLARTTNAPGTLIFSCAYDIQSNGSGQNNLINYGDGTFGFARMSALSPGGSGSPDRGSYFSYLEGTSWIPIQKVEAGRVGWTSTAAMSDGRQVVFSHVGNEANVDALKGFGIWTSSLTGYVQGAVDNIWPRVAVDGKDNIHAVSTVRARIGAARYTLYYPVYTVSRDGGITWASDWLFADPFTELDTTDGQWQGFALDSYAIDASGDKVAIVALAGGAINSDNLWLATSDDNGVNWTSQKLTNNSNLPPPGPGIFTPSTIVDLIYDSSDNVHVFSTNLLSQLDSAGTNISQFHSQAAPLRHWSVATGWTDATTYQDIPGYDPDENIFDLEAINGVGGNNTLLQLPQAGADANGNIYVAFNTVVPHDTTSDGANWMDVYVIGSKDGGQTWGPPVNVTNNPRQQDMWPSVADVVDDNVHIAYMSIPYLVNLTDAAGAAADHYYLAVPKSSIPLDPVSAVSDRPSDVPSSFALHASFPNPFNPSTQISFDLAKAVRVNLSVYDVTGKLVAALVNGKLEAGKHSVTWNANRQPSGVYFAKLEAEGFSQVQKMTLVK